MGKITDALKKVSQEREHQKNIPAVSVKEAEAVSTAGVTKKQSVSRGQSAKKNALPTAVKEFYLAKKTDSSGIDPRIVTYSDYSSPISEQYRILRTALKSYLFNGALKSNKISINRPASSAKIVTVTSSLHAEGKSVTSVNLAVSLARELDSKVLLVDGDLRNGTVHKLLNVENKLGLSEILASGYDYSVGLHPTAINNLFVIPRGEAPVNPSELLGSKKMRSIFAQFRSEPLNYVIIDTPPVIPFTDALILGLQTDGVVMAVQAHRTKSQILKRASNLISQAHVKMLGFILTQTDYYLPHLYGYYYYRNRGENK